MEESMIGNCTSDCAPTCERDTIKLVEKTDKERIDELYKLLRIFGEGMEKLRRKIIELQKHSHDAQGNVVNKVDTSWYI